MLSKARFEQYVHQLNALVNAAHGDVANAVKALRGLEKELANDAIVDAIYSAIVKYGGISAALASELYSEIRKQEIGGDYAPQLASVIAFEAVKDAAYPVAIQATEASTLAEQTAALSAIKNLLDLQVKQPARDTILRNAQDDAKSGAKVARVPYGAETCAFCLMMASRGFVYASKKTAGSMNSFHHGCDCVLAVSWGEGVEGYNNGEKYYAIYSKAADSVDSRAVWDEWDSMSKEERKKKGYKSYSDLKTKKILAAMREEEGIH